MPETIDREEAASWTKIAGAIIHYQNSHRGLSPTDEMIAIESGMGRDAVRFCLKKMERLGLLTDSKQWPRVIKINRDLAIDKIMGVIDPKQEVINGVATSQVETKKKEEKMERRTETKKAGGVVKRLDFFTRARQVAHAIDEMLDRGEAPYGMAIREKVGIHSSGLSRIVRGMVEEGWLEHKRGYHHDYKLTNLGRVSLLHDPEGKKDNEVPSIPLPVQKPPEPRVEYPTPPRPPVVTIRGYAPERPPRPPSGHFEVPDLTGVDSMDLAIELQRRGFRVIR